MKIISISFQIYVTITNESKALLNMELLYIITELQIPASSAHLNEPIGIITAEKTAFRRKIK